MNGESLHILHVEDDPDHAELVRRGFRQIPVPTSVQVIEDGEAALDCLFGRGEYRDARAAICPDIVLLDLRLPKVDGLEVLRAIKTSRKLRQIPVIILTSSGAEEDMAKSYEYHANSYLTKPVESRILSQLLIDLGQYWSEWNRCPGRLPAR